MAKLPIFKNEDQTLQLMQTKWASVLNPLIDIPITSGLLLKNITLVTGDNTINHLLGRKLVGWCLVRKRAAAEIYDKQDANPLLNRTLILNSDADVSVDLWVF